MVDPKHPHAWITVDQVQHPAIVLEWLLTQERPHLFSGFAAALRCTPYHPFEPSAHAARQHRWR